MNTVLLLIVLLLFVGMMIVDSDGYGNNSPQPEYESLFIDADKQTYHIGEVINITGVVERYHENESVQIIVYSPDRRVTLIQKTDVEPDTGKFSIFIDTTDFKKTNQYKIKASYGRYSEIAESTFAINSHDKSNQNIRSGIDVDNLTKSESSFIPSWVRNNAKFWSLNEISEYEFINGIKYLLNQGILNFSPEMYSSQKPSKDLLEIRKSAGWWSEGFITDDEFVKSIGFFLERSNDPQDSVKIFLTPKSYRFGQPITVTLIDPDLNQSSDSIDIYLSVNNPNSPFVDTIGSANGGILLEVRIKDIRYQRCTINDIDHGGLASTGFTLVETGQSTGVFEGVFRVPSQICNKSGTELISTAGGSISLRYHDFRDSFGQSNIQKTR